MTARRGGRAINGMSRSFHLWRGRGGFPIRAKGKPPRLRQLRWLREILLMTQPPLLAVVQGGECAGSEISAPYRFLQDSRTTVFHNASSIHRPTVDHLFLHRKQRRHEFDAVPEVLQAEVFVVAVLVVVMVANGNADLRNAKHAFGHIRSCCAGGWNFHRRASRAFHGPDYFP